jgi:hypothetical protein
MPHPQEDAVALQGDLMSFALPDVLRLLAGTGKSGCLEVTGPSRSGEVWLGEGAIVAGVVSDAPHAERPADVVFELLRLERGAFVFDDGAELLDEHRGEAVDVEDALAEAQALVDRWVEIEAVVPSMEAWLSLAPELPGEEVVIGAQQWRALAAVGSGGSVRDLADALSLTDLDASALAKDLIDAELMALRPSHAYAGPTVELDSFDDFEVDGELDDAYEPEETDPVAELESLAVEDRPVVMEDRDDALLPEPLPGEGVSYEGDTIEVGAVDGRTPTAESALDEPGDGADPLAGGAIDPFEAISAAAVAAADPATVIDASEITGSLTREGSEGVSSPAPFGQAAPAVASDAGSSPEVGAIEDEAAGADDHAGDAPPAAGAAPAPSHSDERGSLLKFLSSVKP